MNSKKKSIRLQVCVTPKLNKQLISHVKKTDESIPELLRRLIIQELNLIPKTVEKQIASSSSLIEDGSSYRPPTKEEDDYYGVSHWMK